MNSPNQKTTKSTKTNIDYLEIFKLTPVLLIIIGLLRLVLYYKAFNINIVKYISIQEMLLAFFDAFLINLRTVIVLCISIFLAIVFKKAPLAHWKKSNLDKEKILYRILIFFMFIFQLIVPYFLGITDYIRYLRYLGLVSMSLIFTAYFFYVTVISKRSIWVLIILSLLILAFGNIITVSSDLNKVKNEYAYYNSKVTFDNNIIESDSILTYIGNTNKYIFFYNYLDSIASIYPMDEVKKIEIREEGWSRKLYLGSRNEHDLKTPDE